MESLKITCSKTYDILIGESLLERAGDFVLQQCGGSKICIITDSNVSRLYSGALRKSLEHASCSVFEYVFPAGEASKTMETIEGILAFLAENRFDRNDVLVALGGGVTGDMTGFAAAIYMRGIKYIQMPTTLLACVDSSIGGKTGVDLPAGKNLAGVFWHPELVIADIDTFDTLTPQLWRDGLAEIIKAGMIADASILNDLSQATLSDADLGQLNKKDLKDIIVKALDVKRAIVEADEREGGARKLLNLGHTIGHAIEHCSGYAVSHGAAVAIGTVMAAAGAEKLGWSSEGNAALLKALFSKYGYSLYPGFDARALAKAALSDKKRRGDVITIVYPERPGKCQLKDLPVSELEQFIQYGLEFL